MSEATEVPSQKSGINSNTIRAGFVIAFGSSLQFGYHHGVLNQPSDYINSFYNDTYAARRNGVPLDPMDITILWSLTSAVIFFPGGVVGSFIGAWLADTIGRKRGLLVSHIFLVIGIILCVICVSTKSPEFMMVGRVFVGVSCGIGNSIAPMFLQEIVQPNIRGAFGALHQLAITLGDVVSSVFGLPQILGTQDRWQYLMLIAFCPVIVSCAIMPFIHESPLFLLLVRKDVDAARHSLEHYRKSKEVDEELSEMVAVGQSIEQLKQLTVRQMFASNLRKALLICCMLQVIKQFSGVNAIFLYSSSIFFNAGVPEEDIPYAIVGTNTVALISTIIVVPLMDIVGRRKLLLIPIVLIIIILSCLTVCIHYQGRVPVLSFISIGLIMLYICALSFGLGPISWVVGSELFRQDARSKAMAGCGMVNTTATFVVGLAFEPLLKIMGHFIFIIFIGSMVFAFFFIYCLLPETKNRTFDEVADELAGHRGSHLEPSEVIKATHIDHLATLPRV